MDTARHAVQVVAGAVQRINHPQVLARALQAALFAEEGVVGMVAPDFPYNGCLAGPVHLAHVVVPGLAGHRDARQVAQFTAHQFAGFQRRLGGNVENGMGHG